MGHQIVDKKTGARFNVRSGAEKRQRDTLHHGRHMEDLLKAIVKVLGPDQLAQLKLELANCPHKCVQRALQDAG
jgi:hypothetical protein